MCALTHYLTGAMLSASMAFTGVASAMQIPQFEKMVQVDQVNYEVLLLEGAIKALNAHGQPDQAKKLTDLFLDKSDKGGFRQIGKNLEIFKAINKENAAKPNNKEPVYEVEHAFAMALKDNDIIVPMNVLFAISKDFKPSQPAAVVPAN